jgi:hypothetical protein
MTEAPEPPAVTALGPKGETVRVHEYQDGDYLLAHVVEIFGLGRMETDAAGHPVLVLRPNEVRQLKPLADSHSFDFEEGFIELCLDLHRFAAGSSAPEIRFRSDL